MLLESALRRREIREVVPEIVSEDNVWDDDADSHLVVKPQLAQVEDTTSVALPARPSDEEPSVAPSPTTVDVGPSTLRVTCEIAVWRGYRKAHFYARTYVDEEEVAVGESPSFRGRGRDTLERTDEAAAAHAVLCQTLREAGWKRIAAGRPWYGDVFQRDVLVAEMPAVTDDDAY
jgi:hypothetical protein